jgi:hypothetical protein
MMREVDKRDVLLKTTSLVVCKVLRDYFLHKHSEDGVYLASVTASRNVPLVCKTVDKLFDDNEGIVSW